MCSSDLIPLTLLLGAGGVILAAGAVTGIVFLIRRSRKRQEQEAELRRERRRQRLAEIGCSEEEFRRLVEERYGKDT